MEQESNRLGPLGLKSYGLSTRTMTCLINAGVRYLDQLRQWRKEDLLRIRHVGRVSLNEIISVLGEHGITLMGEEQENFIPDILDRLKMLERVQESQVRSINLLERKYRELQPSILHLDSLARCGECGKGMMPLMKNEMAYMIENKRVCIACWDTARHALAK